ncbi:UDP-N-acetylglucosamine 2-epimerase (hydrolyzing) [Putridiphycobacter roseus]|uniref:UDP-N-acetylglucosamine 2-epimerase (Hydrolyzing) n=1 Tax=Putridiphycobacter roseus TaxID=2219161 RepID=A0A2W1N0K6_9FLAO|nr:UDP-N-acetylglucosamine 2-epimerase [Putridiphycobacter roseus]PZE16471.1 UDP-N-acetylglucosamine 2-epimerase (hydrolyzing) [Putridiphycobacter roseus]
MKIGVLTSSRADFGIYLPLLKKLQADTYFELELIIFGTHLSKAHGETIQEIIQYNFNPTHQLNTYLPSDSPLALSKAIAHTSNLFADFWANHTFDMVISLGDRYEMYAAVSAASPFNINIAHLHAGETTLGAIDNAYRHCISLFSKYLFVTTEKYKKRAAEIVEASTQIYNVGALSVDNLANIPYLSIPEFKAKFGIDLSKPTILSTFHPETVSFEKNEAYIDALLKSFEQLISHYQIVITMPNTDTMGQMVRDKILAFQQKQPLLKVVESFGMLGYLSCMKHAAFLLGNTSSGFVEATYFPKYVINLGERQKGRLETKNILTTPVEASAILAKVAQIEKLPLLKNLNIYGDGNTAEKIITILKSL